MGINLMSQQNKNTTQITRKLFEAKKKKRKEKKKHYLTQYQRQSKRNYRKHTPFLNGNIPSYVGKNRGIFKLLLRKSRKCTPIHR